MRSVMNQHIKIGDCANDSLRLRVDRLSFQCSVFSDHAVTGEHEIRRRLIRCRACIEIRAVAVCRLMLDQRTAVVLLADDFIAGTEIGNQIRPGQTCMRARLIRNP